MSHNPLYYQLGLTLIPNIGDVIAKNLVSYCGGVEMVFKKKKNDLLRIPGIDKVRAESILGFDLWEQVEAEMGFIKENKIASCFYLDEEYPTRLKGLADAPLMLFTTGKMNLNAGRTMAIVGTRRATEYGKQVTEAIIEGLKELDVTIISGLAYGIDIAAHRAALKYGLQNIAVLGHGLNKLYPGTHKATAAKMMEHGGLVTEFKSIDAFEPQNFPKRNRIVAGLADVTLVIESAVNGGALITAELAYNYNRDVMCIPGRIGDQFSAGCNRFIKNNKAQLVQSATEVAQIMHWNSERKSATVQKQLFIELNEVEQKVVDALRGKAELHIDALSAGLDLYGSKLASTLLTLEFRGVVVAMPGKIYRLA